MQANATVKILTTLCFLKINMFWLFLDGERIKWRLEGAPVVGFFASD